MLWNAARRTAGTAALISILLCGTARASSAPDAGHAFAPAPASTPQYGIKAPSEDPDRQTAFVEAADGVRLYVETWLPAAKSGTAPPAKVPTVLVMTPYVAAGQEEYPASEKLAGLIDFLVPRGYAVAQTHVRGTGESGGCIEQTAGHEPDDGARVVEYLGRDAPWSDGNVGMYGISYDAETQTAVAGLGDPAKTSYLKAIVPAASIGGGYEYEHFDGVPYAGHALLTTASYLLVSAIPGEQAGGAELLQRFPCQPDYGVQGTANDGDFTDYWKARELRLGAPHIRAATLWIHGLADWNVKPIAEAGFYDQIPATTPRKAVLGVWEHAFPAEHSTEPDWDRTDYYPMVLAWYDRYLKGLDTGVERWPDVQVQDSEGQWREEPDWPTAGGPAGQLALGPGGTLGATNPTGSTAYSALSSYEPQGVGFGADPTGGGAVFTTAPMKAPLRISGQPEIDMWASLNLPDARIAAKLEVVDAEGGIVSEHAIDYGYRSMRHLDPFVHGAFLQAKGHNAPTNTPIHVQVRFHPTDLVVPAGDTLRLVLAGTVAESAPSPLPTTITVLHDCQHPTALRFLMPRAASRLLNVREEDEGAKPLASGISPALQADGGGIATAPICGKAPIRDDVLGPERPLSDHAAAKPAKRKHRKQRHPRRKRHH